MQDNKKYIEITNIETTLDELSFAANNFKDMISELESKKDVIKNLENLQSIKKEINEFKEFLSEFRKAEDDFSFLLASSNKIVENLKEYANSFKKHYNTITEILEQQTYSINEYIVEKYDKMFKDIKYSLHINVEDILKRIKELDKLLTEMYYEDYLKDVRKLQIQQKLTNFLLIALIAASAFFVYSVNKKLNVLQNTAYYNYKALYNQ